MVCKFCGKNNAPWSDGENSCMCFGEGRRSPSFFGFWDVGHPNRETRKITRAHAQDILNREVVKDGDTTACIQKEASRIYSIGEGV